MFSHISLFWSSDFFVSLIICIWFTACMLLIFKQIIVLQCHFVTLSVRTQYSKITPAAHLQVARSISRVLISSWHLWKTWQLAPAALVCNYFLVTETNLFCPLLWVYESEILVLRVKDMLANSGICVTTLVCLFLMRWHEFIHAVWRE